MQAPSRSCRPAWNALGIAIVLLLSTSSSVAENLKHAPAVMAANSALVLNDAVMELPVSGPVVMAPEVRPPLHSPALTERVSKEMKRLALKYDVSKIGERNVGSGVNFYSVNKEIDMGRELAAEIEPGLKLVRDPVITEYINRLGQNLVRNSDAKVPFTIKVVNNAEVNAFALPGGFFYVNTGLILEADNEAELAGVMAHEIAHVAARHTTHNITRHDIFNLCTLPAIFVGGPAGLMVREAADLAMPLQYLKFSRDAEREADLLGMEYAYAAGYDPAEMVHFFEKMATQEKQKKGLIARAFDTHPMTAERVTRAQAEMVTMLPAKQDYVVTSSEFNEVKARLAAFVKDHALEDDAEKMPTLRRATDSDDTAQPKTKNDDRPTLTRGAN